MNPLSSQDRCRLIRAALADHLARSSPPAGWQDWSANQTTDYMAVLIEFRRVNSLNKMLPVAARLAGFHGIGMAAIDPQHGAC